MNDKHEQLLWTTIYRALMLVAGTIAQVIGLKQPGRCTKCGAPGDYIRPE